MNTLKNILEQKQIKISDFARSINATPQQVCNWFERGNILKILLFKFQVFLNITLEEALSLKASSKSIQTTEDKKQLQSKGKK